ncbi:uncharacterized protein BXZ73DRAFT_90005 [Epithele typhae]|uniref:uncharacterized protein n=1 Tax=Epithele typhae TaxID=378194 RepID=UPI0020087801|nr:uncharacterized protein BXZ73DRAFT_90005 [Epithele typhae]KAH9932063.1 hypothetical protein BXZ73DRAFT_90005 [Epithele typhae]
MPPSTPIPEIVVTSHSDFYDRSGGLTPRTPHSRAGRAEEGFTTEEREACDDDEANDYRSQLIQESQGLLYPGYRARGDNHDAHEQDRQSTTTFVFTFLKRMPIAAGFVVALLLLAATFISWRDPGTLEVALNIVPPASTSSTNPETIQAPLRLISYENYTEFPLTPDQYRDECHKLMGSFMPHGAYWEEPFAGPLDVAHSKPEAKTEGDDTPFCTSTITYMLDGTVGLAADLALLAQVASFARERNKTLLIEDRHWNRGSWSDHFQNVRLLQRGPEPGCKPPPPSELVACPRTASAKTSGFHFGEPFYEEYEDPYGHHMNRAKPIYNNARASFEEVIRPGARNNFLIRAVRDEIVSTLSLTSPDHHDRRHGDHNVDYDPQHKTPHPRLTSAYTFYPPKGHIPLEKFIDGARTTWDRFYGNKSHSVRHEHDEPAGVDAHDIAEHEVPTGLRLGHDDKYPAPPIMWFASDSPAEAKDFASAFSPATAIFSLARSTISAVRALQSEREYVQLEFNQESLEDRIRLTRGAIVDLAMLGGLWAYPGQIVPGATVCMEGSNVCRMAASDLASSARSGSTTTGHYSGDPNPERARWVDVDLAGRVIPPGGRWRPTNLFFSICARDVCM